MQRKFFLSIFILILIGGLFASNVQAQDDEIPLLAYGESASGEITNRAFEVPYRFEGTAGDTVVVVMEAVDPYGDLDLPSIILLDAEFALIADTYGFGSATLATTLPADGEYNILATRNDGRAGDSVGEFNITLLKPELLVAGEPMTGAITNLDTAYYTIEDVSSFDLRYEKTAGDFNPAVEANIITDYQLDDVAEMAGEYLTSGTLGVSTGVPTIFIIAVKEGDFDYNSSEVSAEFTLTLVAE
jgi:hypothetical protein